MYLCNMLHRFKDDISGIALPRLFTWPFHYVPHPLCLQAAAEVQRYIASREDWREELQRGKMFGVLVVTDTDGKRGFLAAFSGNLAGTNRHEYFVPPVYDMLRPDDFFRRGEAGIDALSVRIEQAEQSERAVEAKAAMELARHRQQEQIAAAKEAMRQSKARRDARRAAGRILRRLFSRASANGPTCNGSSNGCAKMSSRPKSVMRISRHRSKPCEASGTAFQPSCKWSSSPPIAMAEFWWGDSPAGEVRRHGEFYPACTGKCKPILPFMLQGLDVEPNPLLEIRPPEPRVVWEDATLVVIDKPSGMLSVDGKSGVRSVAAWARERYPDATGPIIVHRLDQSTSGLMVLAKEKQTHAALQAQFIHRTVRKLYTALLEGHPKQEEGRITLPLKLDYENRPRQMISAEGRSAVTLYKVIGYEGGRTRILFRPLTGRTHQLRVHAAAPEGLDCPIVGDDIYGRGGQRLCLHASLLEFDHPVLQRRMRFESAPEF